MRRRTPPPSLTDATLRPEVTKSTPTSLPESPVSPRTQSDPLKVQLLVHMSLDRPPRAIPNGTQAPQATQPAETHKAAAATPRGSPLPMPAKSAPFGLPPDRTVEQYRDDPVCRLSGTNYKVDARVEVAKAAWPQLLAILDSGAGPNLIRADHLSEDALRGIDTSREVVTLASASGHSLDVLGITRLRVQVGNQVTSHEFVVTRQLNADVILGCHYLDAAVEDIHVQRRTLELLSGECVPIVRRRATVPTMSSTTEAAKLSRRVVDSHRAIRVTRMTKIPARTQAFVPVQGPMRGLQLISPRPALFDKYRCVVANGVADVKPNVEFYVLVANVSEHDVVLRKHTRVAVATPAPHVNTIFPLTEEILEDSSTPTGDAAAESLHLEEGVVAPDHQRRSLSTKEERALRHLTTKKARKADIFDVEDVPLDDIDADDQSRVREMLRPFQEMWRPGRVGRVNVTQHHIDIKEGARPQYSQPYRAGPHARQVIQNTIDEMLAQDIIEPARSEWAAPVVLAPKPDGTLRFCVDYRKLNAVTVKDRYPLPRMEDCLDSLGDAKFFSTLDCNWGFWQIPLAAEDRHKTAFTTHAGPYQYKRMPFGLCNAPATYQRTLDVLLAGLKWQTCLVYVDDVIVFSKTFSEHLSDVAKVLGILKAAGLSMNMRKCKFFSKTVDYLGHVIRPGHLAVAEKNTAAVRGATYPRTQTELRSFLGTCNVYRRFVPNFAHVAAPLNQLLTKGTDCDLPSPTPEQWKAFELLKQALTSPPVLQLPDPNLEFSIDTDASAFQAGCALFQHADDGVRHPIGFWSRSLSPAERKYSAGEREALAIIFAVQLLHPYLWGRHFTVYTDHQALRWVFGLDDPTGRLSRWALRLQDFDFTVKYKKGADNVVADTVSRLPTYGLTSFEPEVELPVFVAEPKAVPAYPRRVDTASWSDADKNPEDAGAGDPRGLLQWPDALEIFAAGEAHVELITIDELLKAQAEDGECQRYAALAASGRDRDFVIDERGLIVRLAPVDGARQVIIPKSLRARALHLAHHTPVAGHPGVSRQYYTMRRSMYWPSMIADVRSCASRCDACARERVKLRTHQAPLKLFPANAPLEYVAVDILGPLPRASSGHRFILVMTDRFSKLTRAVAMRTCTALAVSKAFLEYWVFAYGAPTQLLTDNGSQFASGLFAFTCSHLGVRNMFTTTYHPQTNGQAERFNRTLLASLRAFVGEHPKTWPAFVGAVTYAYNTQVHSSTRVPPFDLVVTRPPQSMVIERTPELAQPTSARSEARRFKAHVKSLVAEARSQLATSQERYKASFDARINPLKPARAGDWVFVERAGPEADASTGERRRHKLQWRALGPYQVLRADSNTVTLDKDGLVEVVSRDRISRADVGERHAPENNEAPSLKEGVAQEKTASSRLSGVLEGDVAITNTRNKDQGEPENPRGATRQEEEAPDRDVSWSTDAGRQQPPDRHSLRLRSQGSEAVTKDAKRQASQKPQRNDPRGKNEEPVDDDWAPQPLERVPLARSRKRVRHRSNTQEYPLGRVVDHDAEMGLFRCRWSGYAPEADTWEPATHLPYSKVRAYFRKVGLQPPSGLKKTCRPH